MVTSTTLNQQVWVGAGASATMIPEMKIYLDQCDGKGANPTTVDNIMNGAMGSGDTAFTLVPNLYVGCLAEIRNNTDTNFSGTAMITANTVVISFNKMFVINSSKCSFSPFFSENMIYFRA